MNLFFLEYTPHKNSPNHTWVSNSNIVFNVQMNINFFTKYVSDNITSRSKNILEFNIFDFVSDFIYKCNIIRYN